jgi:hypothetical protein
VYVFYVGMDAQVSYAFHSERKLHPEKFKNQLYNQVPNSSVDLHDILCIEIKLNFFTSNSFFTAIQDIWKLSWGCEMFIEKYS